MDLHFQGLKDSYFAGMEQYEERQTAYSDNHFRELRNLIQSTAEAQNALFCQNFRSYLCLSGEIRTLSFLLITLTILILHLNLSLEDFRPRISYLRFISSFWHSLDLDTVMDSSISVACLFYVVN
ncbi:hypothetical protein Lal_00044270 [Lupinus albus]|nr:hypothetical protein Lal_00044270 [Lupinus albus]